MEEDFSIWPVPEEYTIYYMDNDNVKRISSEQDPRYMFTKLLGNKSKPLKLSAKVLAELKASKITPRTWAEEHRLRTMHKAKPSVPSTDTTQGAVVVNVMVDCNQSRTEGNSIESPLSIADDDDGDAGNDAGNHSTNKASKWRTKSADVVFLEEVEKANAHIPEAGTVRNTWTKVSKAMQIHGFTFKERTYQDRFSAIMKESKSINLSDKETRGTMDETEVKFHELLWNINLSIANFELKAEKDAKAKAEKEAKLNAAGKDIRDKGALAIRDGLSVYAAGGETFIDETTGEIMARRSPSEEAIPLSQFKSPGKQDSAAKQVSSAKKHGGEDLVRALLNADSTTSDRKLALEEQKLGLQREELCLQREELRHKQEMERDELKFRMEESRQALAFRMEESKEQAKRCDREFQIKEREYEMKMLELQSLVMKKGRPSKKQKAAESESSDDE
jgi:hypothetical protein